MMMYSKAKDLPMQQADSGGDTQIKSLGCPSLTYNTKQELSQKDRYF